ncbi:MAG TPA: hypothetical protein VMX54_02160 [Vicinamibacteria bacterium]|nr:hypothetical protein [Vicinamibacteria bacterium]
MAWIKTISRRDAQGALKEALEAQHAFYPQEYARSPEDDSESIVESHSLIPEALHHAFATFGVLMSNALPLSRARHEMIATRVSTLNRCHY